MWQDEWEAIKERIDTILAFKSDIFSLTAEQLTGLSAPAARFCSPLIGEVNTLLNGLSKFVDCYRSVLPPNAVSCLDDLVDACEKVGTTFKNQPVIAFQGMCVYLSLLVSRFQYFATDRQSKIKSKTEQAFLHLKRAIAADEDVQTKWQKAFERGEIACEKLGAVHLLQHGIWAFKVDGNKGKTDLVFPEESINLQRASSSSLGLVLTEWKMVRNAKDLETILESAKKQTKNYAQGVLGGLELISTRYLVMVCQKELEVQDIVEEEVLYRVISIPVDPDVPSVSAKH